MTEAQTIGQALLWPLLLAIRRVESADGRDCVPRVEPAYLPKGFVCYCQHGVVRGTGACFTSVAEARWHRWQKGDQHVGTAASWGPWHILYHTAADLGFAGAPHELSDRNRSLDYVRRFLHRATTRGARTVAEFADAYNSGSHRDQIVPASYIERVEDAYDEFRRYHLAGQPPEELEA
jgi:hypothetical protein